MSANLARRFTLCLLLYGNANAAARQLKERWKKPWDDAIGFRFGLNACKVANAALAEIAPVPFICRERTNIGKPALMRRLFHERRIDTEWTIWFDDDSFPYRADWLQALEVAIAAQPDVAMLGVPAVTEVSARMVNFIREAPWYRGVPLEPSRTRTSAARLHFILGGFWAIKTEWIYKLDWPDPRIVHFEDDYLLGEAIRQNGGKLGRFHSGVKVDTEPRRAPPDMPSTLDVWQAKAN